MDADADNRGEKGIPLSGVDVHIMRNEAVKPLVVYPIAGNVIVNLTILLMVRDRKI